MKPGLCFKKSGARFFENSDKNEEVARPERFELPTPRFEAWCSIQLSYGRRPAIIGMHRIQVKLEGRHNGQFAT
jgi:hypothetical protein